MALLSNWYTNQIDFVLAYTQADVECDNMFPQRLRHPRLQSI
jgi:hypothetical protein